MKIKSWWLCAIETCCLTALMTGCGTAPTIPLKSGVIADGTLIVAELQVVFSRDEIINSKDPYMRGVHENLRKVGFEEADIIDGSIIGSTTACHGHNTLVGCAHPSIYIAFVPPKLRGKLVPAKPLKKPEVQTSGGVTVTKFKDSGDIVIIEAKTMTQNGAIGTVKNVYRKHDAWGDCEYKLLGYHGLSIISPLGPPQGQSLDCPGLEQEGWFRYRVPNSPPPGTYEWRKESAP